MQFKSGLNAPRPMTHLPHWSALKMKYGRGTPSVDEVDYLTKLPDNVGMMGNADYGDCFWAANYHGRQVRTLFATGTMITEPNPIVLGAYASATGFDANNPSTDQGTDGGQGFAWLMQNGLPTASGPSVKILGAIELDPRNVSDCLEAMDYCGGLMIGVVLPQSFVDAQIPPSIWDWSTADTASNDGHEVFVGKADTSFSSIGIISWGLSHGYSLTKSFWDNAVNQCTAVISADWIEATGKTPFGMTLDQLNAEIALHSSGPIP